MKKEDPTYIYESPDKGKTVFRHEIGKPQTKELIKVGDDDLLDIVDDHYQEWLDGGYDVEPQYTWTNDNDSIFDEAWERRFKEEVTWKDIKHQAETHPALKSALEQMMTVYHLSKEDEDTNNGI